MKAIENYIKKTLKIDPHSDEIGWDINQEDANHSAGALSIRGSATGLRTTRKTKRLRPARTCLQNLAFPDSIKRGRGQLRPVFILQKTRGIDQT